MKIDVNFGICEANGLCAGAAPEYFDLDDDDTLHLLRDDVAAADEPAVREAASQCPRAAITLRS